MTFIMKIKNLRKQLREGRESGSGKPAANVLDRLEAKYSSLHGTAKIGVACNFMLAGIGFFKYGKEHGEQSRLFCRTDELELGGLDHLWGIQIKWSIGPGFSNFRLCFC
jgi:hypothetical protein